MTTPISFTVRPPSSAPARPSPLGSGNGAGSRQNSRLGPPSRRMFQDADSDSDDEGRSRGSGGRREIKEERVEGFSNGRMKGSEQSKDVPLVIPALPNRDWRESSRRVPSYRPETRKQEGELVTHERTGEEPQRAGLRTIKREAGEDIKPDVAALDASAAFNGADTDIKPTPAQLSLEERALQELLSGDTKPSEEERAARDLVIALQSDRVMSEHEALKRDLGALPEESTMDDFEAVPIASFGMAALRGMGWDPKSADNVKTREVQRRPQLLGLGATPMDTEIRPTHGKSGAAAKREQEKRDKKKTYQERTGRGFSAAGLLVKKEREGGSASGVSSPAPSLSEGGGMSGRSTPRMTREGSVDSAGRRRRREDDESGRESKRRDTERDRDGRRYETEEERARRKARERERERDHERRRDRDGDRDRDRDRDRERDRDRPRGSDRDRPRDSDRDRDRRDRDGDDKRRYRD